MSTETEPDEFAGYDDLPAVSTATVNQLSLIHI